MKERRGTIENFLFRIENIWASLTSCIIDLKQK